MASKDGNAITFTEVDELNNPASTFIYSELQSGTTLKDEMGNGIRGRVDIAHLSGASTPWSVKSVQNLLINIFLPAGYPHSVSEDYIPYQIFDSLQAFSSSIAGLLSSRAVLQGVGVGNADASPTSALLLHILQDTSGRIATILFAHRVGTALEPECKMYRFAADIFNDLAMVLDCLSPMIPAGVSRVTVLSAAGVLRALCGVAGGSSKASLSAHFSKWGNLAEVNATLKQALKTASRCPSRWSECRRLEAAVISLYSSQETVISLVGMLVGSLVVSHITSFTATWLTLLALLTLHLSLNYAAVRSVQMTTLNRQRANIVFSSMLSSDPDFAHLAANQWQSIHQQHLQAELGMREQNQRRLQIPSPADVSRQERIFDASGMLQWHGLPPRKEEPMAPETLGHCQIGVSLRDFMSSSSHSVSTTSNSLKTALSLKALASLFNDEDYILIFTTGSPSLRLRAKMSGKILLKQHATPKTHLKAWMHALLVARLLTRSPPSGEDEKKTGCGTTEMILSTLSRTLDFLEESSRFEGYIDALGDKGWEVDVEGGVSALETRIGRRVVVS